MHSGGGALVAVPPGSVGFAPAPRSVTVIVRMMGSVPRIVGSASLSAVARGVRIVLATALPRACLMRHPWIGLVAALLGTTGSTVDPWGFIVYVFWVIILVVGIPVWVLPPAGSVHEDFLAVVRLIICPAEATHL